jgi:hypothetical protein
MSDFSYSHYSIHEVNSYARFRCNKNGPLVLMLATKKHQHFFAFLAVILIFLVVKHTQKQITFEKRLINERTRQTRNFCEIVPENLHY